METLMKHADSLPVEGVDGQDYLRYSRLLYRNVRPAEEMWSQLMPSQLMPSQQRVGLG